MGGSHKRIEKAGGAWEFLLSYWIFMSRSMRRWALSMRFLRFSLGELGRNVQLQRRWYPVSGKPDVSL
jgi:hypothetical protein